MPVWHSNGIYAHSHRSFTHQEYLCKCACMCIAKNLYIHHNKLMAMSDFVLFFLCVLFCVDVSPFVCLLFSLSFSHSVALPSSSFSFFFTWIRFSSFQFVNLTLIFKPVAHTLTWFADALCYAYLSTHFIRSFLLCNVTFTFFYWIIYHCTRKCLKFR